MNARIQKNSLKRLVSITLAVSTGIFLNLPALASDSTANSKDFLAQTDAPSPGIPTGVPAAPSGSPGTQMDTPTPPRVAPRKPRSSPSMPSSSPSMPSSSPTPQKDSQAVKDSYLLPGGWLCLNNPSPQCRS